MPSRFMNTHVKSFYLGRLKRRHWLPKTSIMVPYRYLQSTFENSYDLQWMNNVHNTLRIMHVFHLAIKEWGLDQLGHPQRIFSYTRPQVTNMNTTWHFFSISRARTNQLFAFAALRTPRFCILVDTVVAIPWRACPKYYTCVGSLGVVIAKRC